MALVLDGTTGIVSANIADGTISASDLSGSLDLTGKTVTLPAGTGGKVLQIIQAPSSTFTTRASTSSTSYVSTGYTLSITPSSTSSKILCIWGGSAHCSGGSYVFGRFSRNGIPLENAQWAIGVGSIWQMASTTFIDEPASTSAVTYELFFAVSGGTGYIGWSSSFTPPSTNMLGWTLIEIAG